MLASVVEPSFVARPLIPDYELLHPIGRGAYGEVWLARNMTGSRVALKIVRRAAFEHGRPFEREFEGIRRFEPISRSDSSQVAILHLGQGEGFFYYVMELADPMSVPPGATCGDPPYRPRTLKNVLYEEGALPAAECLAIATALTRALAHLHRHGLVHRDVKPSNVIVVRGVAKLADIGLVASVDATGSFVGTEGYLPLEGAGTPQADLYSLGKVLYEMSTGCDRHQFPSLPPDFATRPDRAFISEFNAIVLKACAGEPKQRYQSAQQLAEDLACLKTGNSVKRRHRLHQRFRFAVTLAALTPLAALVIATLTAYGNKSARRLADRPPPAAESFETSGTDNLEAYQEYRVGRFFMAKRTGQDISNAVIRFEHVLARDARFARAHAALAQCYNLLHDYANRPAFEVRPKAKAAALMALSLNPDIANAHAALASYEADFRWHWDDAEAAYHRALALEPRNAEVHHMYAMLLSVTGRHGEAMLQNTLALTLEPAALIYQTWRGTILYNKRDFAAAEAQLRNALALDQNFSVACGQLADLLEVTGRSRESLAFRLKADRGTTVSSGLSSPAPALAPEPASLREYWQRERLELESASVQARASSLARACVGVGDYPAALDWMQRACRERDQWVTWLATDALYDPLRNDPRFLEVLRTIGLSR